MKKYVNQLGCILKSAITNKWVHYQLQISYHIDVYGNKDIL